MVAGRGWGAEGAFSKGGSEEGVWVGGYMLQEERDEMPFSALGIDY